MDNIIISVNIPVYNRIKMIRECVDSFIKQTFSDFEIVIVDDGSEDDLSFLSGMDKRVKYLKQSHSGISRAFNLAMENSSGKYIMPFGSDDLATPELLEKMLELMEKYKKKYDVIYSNYWYVGGDGVKHRKINCKTLYDKDTYSKMINRQYISHPGTLWKKEKMPSYDEGLESAVDWELFLTAMEQGVRFKHLNTKLWIYRTGHPRESYTKRQTDCCDRLLRKRGYYFDSKTRQGLKII